MCVKTPIRLSWIVLCVFSQANSHDHHALKPLLEDFVRDASLYCCYSSDKKSGFKCTLLSNLCLSLTSDVEPRTELVSKHCTVCAMPRKLESSDWHPSKRGDVRTFLCSVTSIRAQNTWVLLKDIEIQNRLLSL